MVVVWANDKECEGLFLDYFLPIRHVSFVEATHLPVDYRGGDVHPSYDGQTDCIYAQLVLQPWLAQKLAHKRSQMGTYIAAHIRRTDHVSLAKQVNMYTTDEEFRKFFDASKETIYLATDNAQTFATFQQTYGQRIGHSYPKHNDNSLRTTTLQDSILDLFMCVHARKFKGSGYSSFSDLIHVLRRCKKI
jgi:hypothetical protein